MSNLELTPFLIKVVITLIILKFPVISRVGEKFYCQHCNKTVSKSTFYAHQALYGDTASAELELDPDCDSENDAVTPCWDDEDRQFFSEVDDSSDDNGNDEVVSEVAAADENESSAQPEQQIQVIFKCLSHFNNIIRALRKKRGPMDLQMQKEKKQLGS